MYILRYENGEESFKNYKEAKKRVRQLRIRKFTICKESYLKWKHS